MAAVASSVPLRCFPPHWPGYGPWCVPLALYGGEKNASADEMGKDVGGEVGRDEGGSSRVRETFLI